MMQAFRLLLLTSLLAEARVEGQHVEVMSAAPPGTVRVNAIAVEVMSSPAAAGGGSPGGGGGMTLSLPRLAIN